MMGGELGAILLAVATLLIGGGGVASIVRLFQERHKPKLDNRAVEVATAGDSVGMSLELATTAMAQVNAFREEVEDLRPRIREAENKATQAEQRAIQAERAVDAWADWADNVVREWPRIRLLDTPPELPRIMRTLLTGTYEKRTDGHH